MFLFKLTDSDGLIRRVEFAEKPNWPTLATRISSLYKIPLDRVAVTYVDDDDDEVTLSSIEELQDYYRSCYKPGVVIKFLVRDLGRAKVEQDANTRFTPMTGARKPFSPLPVFGDVDGDWTHFPPLAKVFLSRDDDDDDSAPHAYVETLTSESKASSQAHDNDTATEKGGKSFIEDESTPVRDKGKATLKANEGPMLKDNYPSAESLIANSPPTKFPIHVYDLNSSAGSKRVPQHEKDKVPSRRTSRVTVEDEVPDLRDTDAEKTGQVPAPDPTLPSQPSSSLSQDVASLLNDLMNVFNTHPEISERFRNIARNVSNGVYWHSHRDTLSRAADDVRRAAQSGTAGVSDDLRHAEEEAGRRVSEALANLMGALGGVGSWINPPASANAVPQATSPPPPQPRPEDARPSSWSGIPRDNAFGGAPPPPPPPPRPPVRDLRPHFYGYPRPWWGNNPYSFVSGPAPHPPPVIPRHIPPPPPHSGVPPFAHRPHWSHGPHGAQNGVWPPPPPPPNAQTETAPQTPHDLRDGLEAAKAQYKAQKERYLREKEARKKERERKLSEWRMPGDFVQGSSHTAKPAEESNVHLVSNARGPFPKLEMYGVPGRRSYWPSQSYHVGPQDLVDRIARRLADMGFTEANGHTDLQDKIKAKLTSEITSKEAEDGVVDSLLDDILSQHAHAPGSGSGSKTLPGSYQP